MKMIKAIKNFRGIQKNAFSCFSSLLENGRGGAQLMDMGCAAS